MNNDILADKKALYILFGKIVHGRGRGKEGGMPTANMEVKNETVIPPVGVYISIAILNEKEYIGVTNIGKRPSVDNDNDITIETHILDFQEELYGQKMELRLYLFLRATQKFPSFQELKAQVSLDSQRAKDFFSYKKEL